MADAWRWPLLKAANLLAPDGTNIAFVDAIPLLAVLLKLVAPILPPAFHGIGLWYAIAWILQPVAAVWCLRGSGQRRLLPALAVAVAAVSMPAWWDRFVHAALCGQFVLLLALGLYLRLVASGGGARLWYAAMALQLASLFIHPYLALMVLALLGATPLTLALRRDPRWRADALGFTSCALAFAGAMGLFGYLGARGGAGFGIYSMDLLSPFWPAQSALFPIHLERLDASGGPGREGYNYLGAGLLFGLAIACFRLKDLTRMVRRHAGLALVLGLLILLALSHRPAFGGHVLLELIPIPAWIENLRSSGRFFWPVAYAALVATVLLAARHPSPRVGAVLVTAIATLQFADAAMLRAELRERLASPTGTWMVDAPALRALLAHQESLTLLPSWSCVPAADPVPEQRLLMSLLVLASESGLPASTMYLARWQGNLRCRDRWLAAAPLGKGELRVLTPLAQAAYLPLVPRRAELCSPLGTLVVCRDPAANGPPPTSAKPPSLPHLAEGEIDFSALGSGSEMLGDGWSYPEPDGRWSVAEEAVLEAERPSALAGPLRIEIELEAMAPSADRPQVVELWRRNQPIARWALPDRQRLRLSTVLPPEPPGPTRLEFQVAAPTRPLERAINADARTLGIKLYRLRVTRDASWPVLAEGDTAFNEGAPGTAALGPGWSWPENEGVWSDGKVAVLNFVRPPGLPSRASVGFEVEGLGRQAGEPQTVELWSADRRLALWELPDRQRTWVTAPLPPDLTAAISLRLEVASPTRPVDRGLGGDIRRLGVRLWRIRLPVENPAPWLELGSYRFGGHDAGTKLLGSGWAEPGAGNVALAGERATLRFRRPPSLSGPLKLTLELRRIGPVGEPPQVDLWLWGHRLATSALGNQPISLVEALLPAGSPQETVLELRVPGHAHDLALTAACIERVHYHRRAEPCILPTVTRSAPLSASISGPS